MRVVAIPALLLLALAGLAVIPHAAAAGPDCSLQSCEVRVAPMSCPLAGSWKPIAAGPVVVLVYTCDDPTQDPSAAPPCACPAPACVGIDTIGPVAEVVRVTLTNDCRVIVSVLPHLVACGEPLDGSKSITVGRVTVILPCGEIGYCEPPFECAPATTPFPPALALCNSRDLCNDAGCPYPVGADNGLSLQAGPVSVHNDCGPQDLCSGPFRCTSPFGPIGAAGLPIPPVCIERDVQQGAIHAGYSSCYDEFVEVVSCSGGSAQRVYYYRDLGPAYVLVDVCYPHSPPPGLAAPASDPGPCGAEGLRCPPPAPLCSGISGASSPLSPSFAGPVAVGADVSPSCHVDLYVKADVMDCLFGEDYNEGPTVGPVTVWTWGCKPPTTTESSASAVPPCVCPPPKPLCYEPNRAIAWGPIVEVDDWCNVTVNLEAYCGLQGTPVDHQAKAPKVTVNYQTCQGPPPDSPQMADPFPTCVRECSPLPTSACELRDATPDQLEHPVWGYDCTLDVQTACLGGSDGSTDARVGFVDVSLAHCDTPDWS